METDEPPTAPVNKNRKKRGRPRLPRDGNIVEAIIDSFNREEEARKERLQVMERTHKGKTYYVDIKSNDGILPSSSHTPQS